MATTASTIESTAGAAGSPFDQEQLLAGPLSQPVLAASDPLTLPDPSQQSLTISEEQASASGLGWDALDAAVASLGAEPAPVSEPSPAHLDVEPASTLVDLDQLTGLLAATDPNVLPASLVEGNLPPLLGEAFSTDQLLAQPDAAAIDLLAAVDAIRLGEGAEAILLPASAADPALEPAPLERRFTLEEDQLFSLAL
ncbi:MAG: hypothetical protein RLZZ515_2342, partial [Cyanobacteriota bacterium]